MAENSKIEWTDHTWNPWIGETGKGRVLKVQVCYLRGKLKAHNITIEAVRGVGYRLSPASREMAAEFLKTAA